MNLPPGEEKNRRWSLAQRRGAGGWTGPALRRGFRSAVPGRAGQDLIEAEGHRGGGGGARRQRERRLHVAVQTDLAAAEDRRDQIEGEGEALRVGAAGRLAARAGGEQLQHAVGQVAGGVRGE